MRIELGKICKTASKLPAANSILNSTGFLLLLTYLPLYGEFSDSSSLSIDVSNVFLCVLRRKDLAVLSLFSTSPSQIHHRPNFCYPSPSSPALPQVLVLQLILTLRHRFIFEVLTAPCL